MSHDRVPKLMQHRPEKRARARNPLDPSRAAMKSKMTMLLHQNPTWRMSPERRLVLPTIHPLHCKAGLGVAQSLPAIPNPPSHQLVPITAMNLNLMRTPCKRIPRITTLIPPHEPQNAKLSVMASSAPGISTTVGQALFLAIHSKNKASLCLSSWGFPGAAETDRKTIGTPDQMDVDEVDHRAALSFQRGIPGPKRKSSITHSDSQVMQEINAMVVPEQQGSQSKVLHNKRPRLQPPDFTVTNLFHNSPCLV